MTTAAQTARPARQAPGILEICVDNAEGLFAAIAGGADRIELCSALSVGGLTPSAGFMELAGRQDIAVTAMIRPRAGGFLFSTAEIDIMKRDIDATRDAGLTGVALGVSRANGTLDVAVLEDLCRHAEGLDLTLHRAVDVTPDLAEALEAAISLGFSRILTSGGRPTAVEGIDQLAMLVEKARGCIAIMPGSGVRPETAGLLLERLAVDELHASCAVRGPEQDPQLVELSFASRQMLQTDQDSVRRLKALLTAARRQAVPQA